MLQGVGQRMVRGIPFGPEAVPLRKLLRCKRGQPEQIIGSVLDHVDAQIVSCINAKVRPLRIAKLKPSQLRQPVQGRVFHPLDLRNIDQPPDGLFLKNLSVRRKHFPQLERDRKSTRLNSSHGYISYAVFCLKKKNKTGTTHRTGPRRPRLPQQAEVAITITPPVAAREHKEQLS